MIETKARKYKAIIYEMVSDGCGGIKMRPVTSAQELSVPMVAGELGVDENTVYRLCQEGHLTHRRISPRRITISVEDLVAYKERAKDPEHLEMGRENH